MFHAGVPPVLEFVGDSQRVSGDRVWILGVRDLPPEPVRPMQEAVQRADQQFGKPTDHRSGEVKQRYHTSSVTEYRMIPLFFNLVHLREVRLEGIILPHITYTQSQIQYTRSASAKAMAARWITNA